VNPADAQNGILSFLYRAPALPGRLMSEGNWASVRAWEPETSLSDGALLSFVAGLETRGFLQRSANSRFGARLTREGLRYVEADRLAPDEDINRNLSIRRAILEYLASAYERNPARDYGVFAEDIKGNAHSPHGISEDDFVRNTFALTEDGFVEETFDILPQYAISADGHAHVLRSRALQQCRQAFEEMDRDGLSPRAKRARGHALERLVRDLAEGEGWDIRMNSRRPGEETDLILYREPVCYLVECKWIREKVQTHHLRELTGRLDLRKGAIGVFVSLSGFSPQAVKLAGEIRASKQVLLFGRGDILALLQGRSLAQSLSDKMRALAVDCAVLVDGQAVK